MARRRAAASGSAFPEEPEPDDADRDDLDTEQEPSQRFRKGPTLPILLPLSAV
jgi:hypothetical protein